MTKYNTSVVGLGFVGLSLAVANARAGFDTVGVDTDDRKVDRLKACKVDFVEPGMDTMLRESIDQQKIHFTTDIDYAIQNSEMTFLTVGTPLEGGEVDLSYVKSAVTQIAISLSGKEGFHLLAVKSTVPPLTTEHLILPAFKELIEDGKMDVVVNPEFLRGGSAIADVQRPHLVVIGSNGGRGATVMEKYCRDFYKAPPDIIHTSIPTAELIKYANNAFLATKISFINFMGSLCQKIPGADVNTVARAIGKDPRIGPLFLHAGPGFGGSCLPKDLTGMIKLLHKLGENPDLLRAVMNVNDRQLDIITNMMSEQGILAKGNTVAVLGLAFKSGTDDVRGAVSVRVVTRLLEYGLNVKVNDPMAVRNFERIFGSKISYHTSINECIKDSNCCVILTDWTAYKTLMPHDFKTQMKTANIIDARRVLDAEKFQGTNFRAVGLGS